MLAFPSHLRELADRDRQVDPGHRHHARCAAAPTGQHPSRAAIIERYGHERIKLAGRALWRRTSLTLPIAPSRRNSIAFINIAADAEGRALALAHWRGADNLTDVMSAMAALRVSL